MALTYEQLRQMSDEELIDFHNESTRNMAHGLEFALNELSRRQTERQTETLIRYTAQIRTLTFWIAGFTAINVLLAALLIFGD